MKNVDRILKTIGINTSSKEEIHIQTSQIREGLEKNRPELLPEFDDVNDNVLSIIIKKQLTRERELFVAVVELKKPADIDRISKVIQYAITYRILFLFVSQERYLFVCRSFEYNAKSRMVHSDKIISNTFKWKWLYDETLFNPIDIISINSSLNKDADFKFEDYDEDDSGKEINKDLEKYFKDILWNITSLCSAYTEGQLISFRELMDWGERHAYDNYDIKKAILNLALEETIYDEDHLYFEKAYVENALQIRMMPEARDDFTFYDMNIGGQGRYPVYYFDSQLLADYSDEDDMRDEIEEEKERFSD